MRWLTGHNGAVYDLGRRRKEQGEGAHRHRLAGRLREARHGAFGKKAAGKPDDQQDLDDAEPGARRPVRGPSSPVPEATRQTAAESAAERLADARPRRPGRPGPRSGGRSGRSRPGGPRTSAGARMASDAAADRADETRDLRDGARPPAEDQRDDDQEEGQEVDRVHRPIVAQDARLRRRPMAGVDMRRCRLTASADGRRRRAPAVWSSRRRRRRQPVPPGDP